MTTTENTTVKAPNHLIGAVLFVQDFTTLALNDIRTNDQTGALHSLNRVALVTDSAIDSIVTEARLNGTTWQMIADALDISKQAAQQKFGPPIKRRAEYAALAEACQVPAEVLDPGRFDAAGNYYPTSLV